MDLPDFSVCGISQVRILEWVAISFSRDLPNPGIKPKSPALQEVVYLLQEVVVSHQGNPFRFRVLFTRA